MGNKYPKVVPSIGDTPRECLLFPSVHLPQEIFEHVLSNIQDKRDIFNVIVVCKAWQSASLTSKILWLGWLKRLTGVERDGVTLFEARRNVTAIFRKQFVARVSCKSDMLSSQPATINCIIENLSSTNTLYLHCGQGMKAAREHSYTAGGAICITRGVGRDFGVKSGGLKDEWPSLWHTSVPCKEMIAFETTIQLLYVTVEYYDNESNLRETKKQFVVHYGYHYWQVVDSTLELSYTCKASFQPPPTTSQCLHYNCY
eukprot:TRINITY_DN5746_c0_g1_i1.p1 TRINITY_DN5746_c0_g1~~TRINITY_DN5746_c0_g1_i1.p1  ORF type:complete len:269 (+),score=19.47 TRINITY_DN5746_c0_g1_i1:37-807(+)